MVMTYRDTHSGAHGQVVLAYGAESNRKLGIPGEVCAPQSGSALSRLDWWQHSARAAMSAEARIVL